MDTIDKRRRSENMRRIRSKNTKPELILRKQIYSLGYRGYRINRNNLPGKPDITFTLRRKIIFMHGCFWHRHNCIDGVHEPKTNKHYWNTKLRNNVLRDKRNLQTLRKMHWKVLIVWECQLDNKAKLSRILQEFLK